jgi:hypothetical protein
MQRVAGTGLPSSAPKFPYTQRSCAAGIASLGCFGLGVQLYCNIEEALETGSPVASHIVQCLSYFTNETNLLIVLALTAACARPHQRRFLTRPDVHSALVVYIIVVGAVYALMLRHLWQPEGIQLYADHVLHDAMPLLFTLYWLVFLPKGSLRWSDPAWWLLFPVAFFIYTMLRGAILGIYPYPFIDPLRLGAARVFLNASALLSIFFVLGVALTAIDRALAQARGQSRHRRDAGALTNRTADYSL